MKHVLLVIISIVIVSCTKDDRTDDCGNALTPSKPPSVLLNIIDSDSNDLVFAKNAKFPFGSLKLYTIYGDTIHLDKNSLVMFPYNGDTVLRIENYGTSESNLHFPNGGGVDTIKFVNTRSEKGICFPVQFYDFYYNGQLVLSDFSSTPDKPVYIIK